MNIERFQASRRDEWQELDALITRARSTPERLGSSGVRRLGTLYRKAASDVSFARQQFPGDPLTTSLEARLRRAYPLVYDTAEKSEGFFGFWSRGYWVGVREHPVLLFVALGLMWLPMLGGWIWGQVDPQSASGVVPAMFADVLETGPTGDTVSLTSGDSTGMSAMIFVNNVRVAIMACAGGFVLGLGTAYILVYNGLFAGAFFGVLTDAGFGARTLGLLAPHGILELSLFAVAGYAGFRLAWAIAVPGRRSRAASLQAEAIPVTRIMLGTMALLVLAGFIEGFITPAGWGPTTNVILGIVFAATYWLLVVLRGGRAVSPANTP